MFRKLNRIFNKKGQNTAEYALLISLVVAAIIAMQTYAQRALQARIREASVYMVNGTQNPGGGQPGLGGMDQYEPYYLTTNYEITRDSNESQLLGINMVARSDTSTRARASGGFQAQAYNIINEVVGH